jgi:hypothetical protein
VDELEPARSLRAVVRWRPCASRGRAARVEPGELATGFEEREPERGPVSHRRSAVPTDAPSAPKGRSGARIRDEFHLRAGRGRTRESSMTLPIAGRLVEPDDPPRIVANILEPPRARCAEAEARKNARQASLGAILYTRARCFRPLAQAVAALTSGSGCCEPPVLASSSSPALGTRTRRRAPSTPGLRPARPALASGLLDRPRPQGWRAAVQT